jgi:CubicO group peptidase (beta-lactamase class C family)
MQAGIVVLERRPPIPFSHHGSASMTPLVENEQDTPGAAFRFSRRSALAASALGVAAGIGAAVATRASAQATPAAPSDDWSWLDQAVEEGRRIFGIVGTAVAVVNKSGIIHSMTSGVRDQTTQQPVTTQTLFAVGSTTKSMTSLMVATHVDEGALNWDQPVKDVWPDFRAPNDELTQSMRVRDLMGMDSGIGEPSSATFHFGESTAIELVRSLASYEVIAPPQTTFFYNNAVYASGGYLPFLSASDEVNLETAYASAIHDRVFAPVGMQNARLTSDPRPFTDDFAVGNEADLTQGITGVPWGFIGSYSPAGATMASLDDMTNYVSMQLGAGISVSGNRVVSSENLKACWEPHINTPSIKEHDPDLVSAGYAMGWLTQTYRDGHTLTWHNGGIDGFISYMGFFEADDLGLVVLTNNGMSANGSSFYPYLLNTLLYTLYGLNEGANDALIATHKAADQQLQTLAASATAVSKETIGQYLGYYERGYVLAFDDQDVLWLNQGRRSFRIMALPDGDYVIASGIITGNLVKFSTDANSDGWLEIDQIETVRWLQGI